MKKTFISKLRLIRILCFGIIIIPFLCNILISELISKICASAMLGEVNKVLEESIKLFISFLALLIIPGLLETFMNNYKSVILQKLKFLIYDRVIQNTKYVFSNFGKGELRECLTDNFMQVVNRYSFLFPRLVGIAVVCMGYLIYMYVNSPIVAFTVGAISVIQFIPPFIVKRLLQQSYNDTRDIEAQMTDCLSEGIKGFSTIKSFSLNDWWIQRVENINSVYKKIGKKSIYTSEVEKSMNAAVKNILQYGIYGILGLYVLKNMISFECSIKAIAISGSFFSIVNSISGCISVFFVSKEAEKRLDKIIGVECCIQKDIVESKIVSLDKVRITIDENSAVDLENKNVQMIGKCKISGKNGAGKTTLLNAIVGMGKNIEGKIYVGDKDSDCLSKDNFPNNITYLLQEDLCISVTPAELFNVCLGKDKSRAYEIAYEFGLSQEEIDMKLLNEISSGQRKKVLLSVAIAIHPQILILDEPTNSLDEKGKNVLFEYLKVLDSTIILVTHDQVENSFFDLDVSLTSGGK